MTMQDENTDPLPWMVYAQTYPKTCACIVDDRHFTWRDVQHEVEAMCGAIQEQGIQSGEVITLLGSQTIEWVWLLLAAWRMKLTLAFVAPQPTTQIIQKLQQLYAPETPVWLVGDTLPEEILFSAHWRHIHRHTWESLRQSSRFSSRATPSARPSASISIPDCRNPLSLVFTSGSSGRAKAVAHHAHHHMASARGLLSEFHYTQDDMWLMSLPMFHVSGLSIVFRWLCAGGRLKFSHQPLPQSIQQVTHASLVPVQLQRLLKQRPPLSLKRVLLGGSHIPNTLIQQAKAANLDVWVGYGLTEAASTVTARRATSNDTDDGCGYVLPYRRLRIQDQQIYIAGETLAAGYFHQGHVTSLLDEAGWFATADMGYWQHGSLYLLGRMDHLFISGGENIHCEVIEAVIQQHPAVQSVVVVPVPDAEYGMRPVAVVAGTQPMSLIIDDLEANFLPEQLEKYKWPDQYYVMPERLMSSGIKVSRAAVKHWVASQREDPTD